MSEEAPRYSNEPTYIVSSPQSKITVRIKKLHPDAIIPTKATPQSACYDVYAPYDFTVHHGRSVLPLGLAIELPAGYAAEIRPRSGYSSKGFAGTLADTEYRFNADILHGIIDSDYRNEIGAIIISHNLRSFTVKKGQRIAQMLIMKTESADFREVEVLSGSERHGGFGHTGI